MQGRRHVWVFVLIVVVAVGLGSCREESGRRLGFLVDTEGTEYTGVPVAEERIKELQGDIARFEDEVAEVVTKMNQIGEFHKLLAQAYLEQEMYGLALDSLERAMEIQTENPILYYYAAVASARNAKAHVADGSYQEFIRQAEEYYQIALRIDPDYVEALYGIAVLYAFELEDPDTAMDYVQRLLAREPNHTGGAFLKGNVLVQLGRLEEAFDVYDRLSSNAPEPEQRQRARENRELLLQELDS